jgi:hypothetical protein
MLRPIEARAEEARKKARELFQRDRAKDEEVIKERERAFVAQAQKTAKLKALRLARDAENEAAAVEAKTVAVAAKSAAKAVAKADAKPAKKPGRPRKASAPLS